jgi:phosphoribosylformimino-5-aminoimidazole carboxamide ribotide isomerase
MLVIPALDLKEGKAVRLRQGDPQQKTVYSTDPVGQARSLQEQGAELLHVVDLDGALTGSMVHLPLIERIARSLRIPIQVGGGIRNLEAVSSCLAAGAERVILGTRAATSPGFLGEACSRFPGRILLALDARDGYLAVEGWSKSTSLRAIEFAREASCHPLEGIIYTDIRRDGMLRGPNLVALRQVAEVVSVPLIASGGISSLEDVKEILSLEAMGVVGMIIGRALYSGDIDLAEALALARQEKVDAG